MLETIASLAGVGQAAIERIWPDPIKRAEEMRKLKELEQTGDLTRLDAHVKLLLAQLEVNKVEAAHKSLFVAGWRPYIGWVCGFGLTYQFVLYPILAWNWAALQASGIIGTDFGIPPVLDMEVLMVLITGMLGIGGLRSFDKKNGVQTDSLR